MTNFIKNRTNGIFHNMLLTRNPEKFGIFTRYIAALSSVEQKELVDNNKHVDKPEIISLLDLENRVTDYGSEFNEFVSSDCFYFKFLFGVSKIQILNFNYSFIVHDQEYW